MFVQLYQLKPTVSPVTNSSTQFFQKNNQSISTLAEDETGTKNVSFGYEKTLENIIADTLTKLGLFQKFPATSCKAILEIWPNSPSNAYWIKPYKGSTTAQKYCFMTSPCGNFGGGWLKLAFNPTVFSGAESNIHLNITQALVSRYPHNCKLYELQRSDIVQCTKKYFASCQCLMQKFNIYIHASECSTQFINIFVRWNSS